MIASRHLVALTILLALACVPTILHSYLGRTAADSHDVDAVPMRLNGLEGRPSGRSPAWVREAYGTSDFIERQYGPDLTLFVARSYDAKRLYHHPENAVAYGDGYERAIVIRRPQRPDVPIFVLTNARDRLSAYTLLYEGEFVEHPMRFQLRNALTLLVRPRALMTLLFVRAKARPDALAAVASSVEALLLTATDSFLAQSGTPLR